MKFSLVVILLGLAATEGQKQGDLFWFSSVGDVPKVTSLLASGVDPNKAFHGGLTSLHAAASKDKVDVAKVLFNKGADLNITNGRGETPLHHAVRFNSINTVAWLLSQGAPYSLADRAGQTPVQVAMAANNKAVLDVFKQFKIVRRK